MRHLMANPIDCFLNLIADMFGFSKNTILLAMLLLFLIVITVWTIREDE